MLLKSSNQSKGTFLLTRLIEKFQVHAQDVKASSLQTILDSLIGTDNPNNVHNISLVDDYCPIIALSFRIPLTDRLRAPFTHRK